MHLLYIALTVTLKGARTSNLIKKLFLSKKKGKRTCCATICMSYQRVKGLFRKTC